MGTPSHRYVDSARLKVGEPCYQCGKIIQYPLSHLCEVAAQSATLDEAKGHLRAAAMPVRDFANTNIVVVRLDEALAILNSLAVSETRRRTCVQDGHVWVGTGDERVVCDDCGVEREQTTPSHVAPKYATPPFSEADRIRQQGPQAVSVASTTPLFDVGLLRVLNAAMNLGWLDDDIHAQRGMKELDDAIRAIPERTICAAKDTEDNLGRLALHDKRHPESVPSATPHNDGSAEDYRVKWLEAIDTITTLGRLEEKLKAERAETAKLLHETAGMCRMAVFNVHDNRMEEQAKKLDDAAFAMNRADGGKQT